MVLHTSLHNCRALHAKRLGDKAHANACQSCPRSHGIICAGALLPFTSREDVDFFSHLEMHLRQEHPPLAGRDHLAYRGAYFPVSPQCFQSIWICCASSHPEGGCVIIETVCRLRR
jgi:hypothetical protein